MRIFFITFLVVLPTIGAAQIADDEFCDALGIFEALSEEDYVTLEEWGENDIDELLSNLPQSIGVSDELAEGWLRNSVAMQIANCYMTGRGTERDINRAMAVLRVPASEGHSTSVHMLASLQVFFSEDPELQREGFLTLEREAEAGSAYSAGKVGWAYQKGLGVDQDRKKALELYEYAAQSGMTYWQYLLAHAYEKGYLGLDPDPERATDWVAYKPKIHVALYECWVAIYYADGTFPANEELQAAYQDTCDDTDLGEWWAQFQSE